MLFVTSQNHKCVRLSRLKFSFNKYFYICCNSNCKKKQLLGGCEGRHDCNFSSSIFQIDMNSILKPLKIKIKCRSIFFLSFPLKWNICFLYRNYWLKFDSTNNIDLKDNKPKIWVWMNSMLAWFNNLYVKWHNVDL